MNKNNNLGMVDNLAVDSSIAETQQALLEDSRPPVDNSFPSINKTPYQPDTYDVGVADIHTQVVDTDHHLNQAPSTKEMQGVYSPYTSESNDAWERRVKSNNHNVYNVPVTQTKSVAPNVSEPLKPTKEQLSQLRKRDRLIGINNRLKSLQVDRRRTALKLKGIDEAIKNIQTEVEDLEHPSPLGEQS